MGFNLSAFGAGFAEAASEDIQRNRKLAELRGTEAVKNMQLNYKKVIEDNKAKESELVENLNLLKTYDPSAKEDELYAIATKAPVMSQITSLIKDKSFDPASFKLSNFVKVAENNVTATALERVKLLSVLPTMAKEAVIEQMAPSDNIFKDMVSRSASKAKEKAMLEQAQAIGIPLERLRAAQNYIRPSAEVNAVVDMSKLRPEKTYSDIESQAKLESFNARQSGDPAAIAAASNKMANVVAVNTEASLTGKTEAQIQSQMINNIQRLAAAGKLQEASTETALLRQRQNLERLPSKEGKTDADKITQANKIQVASRAVLAAVQDSLPPGSFITVTDREGNVTTELKDLTQSSRYDLGVQAGRQQMIKRFTINGKPKGEAEQNALASIGVQFDDKGIAFVPKVERPVTERRNPTAAPSGGGRLGSAGAGRNVAPAATAVPAPAPRPTPTAAPAARPTLVWDAATNSFVNK